MGSPHQTFEEKTSITETMAPTMMTGYAEEAMSKTHTYRKVVKPLIERKRRARINSCLDELKDLMVFALQTEGESISKLEEAEEAADVELEPRLGHGQVPRGLHHLRHGSEPQPCLLRCGHLHRVPSDGTPRTQAEHRRELKGGAPEFEGARAQNTEAPEDGLTCIRLWILLREGLQPITSAPTP